MFGLFNKKKLIKGEIGYFGLQDWWLSTFSQEERNHIEEIFKPLGGDPNDKPLTEGDITWTSQTAAGLLGSLAGWFNNPRDREIAKKIIQKADKLASQGTAVLDHHFALQQKMEIYYRERETSPGAMETAIQACREQIALAPQAAQAFQKEYPGEILPAHAGYSQLRIILEKQGKFDEAIELCEQAKQQGWSSNWDKQIETLNKKEAKN
jgi:tetratricopeptide (TPR) repeat protein